MTAGAVSRDNDSMRVCPSIFLLLVLLGGAGSAQDSKPAQTKPVDSPQQRVILWLNRDVSVAGVLELEDEQIMTVRTPKNEVESHLKARVLAVVRLVDPQPNQEGVVFLRNGQTREGVIIEDHYDYVLMDIKGVRAKLKRELVDHVILSPTIDERYAAAKAALQPGSQDAHLALCQWLYQQRRYSDARNELLELLEKDDMPPARKLLTQVEAQIALSKKPEPQTKSDDPASPPDDPAQPRSGPVYPKDILPSELISREDVNIIRVYEIDFDHPLRVTITPDTIRTLIEKYGSNSLVPNSQTGRNNLFRADPLDIVRLMFSLRARDLYSQIQVNSEPYALNLFRQRVHDTWLINSCATNHCHGGLGAGALFLHSRNVKEDRVRYTNLLILERLSLDPAWPLINYEKPEDSLIIQYGLPRDLARKPHPLVDGWKPIFGPASPKLMDGTVEWIKAMMQPRPDYPVKYDPPRLKAATTQGEAQSAENSQPSR